MDDIVQQAMAKWPNVPDCYGWLGLDARGNWYMRDEAAQHAGAFASGQPRAKGSRVEHAGLIGFIQRNYAKDADGCWYFQNGPQRVYIELEATPWVWRIDHRLQISAHDGQRVTPQTCMVDEHGWLYMQTSLGFGLVHTQDVACAAPPIEAGEWTLHEVRRIELPQRFQYVCSPQAAQSGT